MTVPVVWPWTLLYQARPGAPYWLRPRSAETEVQHLEEMRKLEELVRRNRDQPDE